jgi:ATP-dependent DNA helicase DinG
MIDARAVFAADGPLARALPGYGPRPQQQAMADEVASAIVSGRHLVVEAGTGVGKSLAYLVPAILWVSEAPRGGPPRRVVVSTFTRALQEQLARKDLPLLERALEPAGIAVRYALLMGSENYLCVQRLEQARTAAGPAATATAHATLDDLARHAGTAPSGLRSEIPFFVPDALWSSVRRERDVCMGPRGPFWDACLYRRDLVRAREAGIVVVNHALFFLDLALGGRILPPHDLVILDEAHRAEEAAAAQLGTSIGPVAVARLLRDIGHPGRGARRGRRPRSSAAAGAREDDSGRRAAMLAGAVSETGVGAAAAEVARAAEDFFVAAGRGALDLAARRRAGRAGRDLAPARPGESVAVRLPPGALPDDRLKAPLLALADGLETGSRAAADQGVAATLAALAMRVRDLRDRLSLFLSQSRDDLVYWAETDTGTRPGASLAAAPVEVGATLRTRLFDSGRTVVLTSATLSAAGSFGHVRRRLGLTAAGEAALGSPFDFQRQARLYIPATMPDPGGAPQEWAEAVAAECGALVEASDGGALVLFTSYSLLNRVHEALRPRAAARGRPLLKHAPDGTATALLEEFRAARRAVLLGALTFWQGVDVPGEALRLVILTRLPFEIPDHPVAEARAETIRARGGDPFLEDSLPDAILTFRQGFGRLIRSHEDRGVVAILDPRVETRAYGAAFLESIPACPRAASIEEVSRFFAKTPS